MASWVCSFDPILDLAKTSCLDCVSPSALLKETLVLGACGKRLWLTSFQKRFVLGCVFLKSKIGLSEINIQLLLAR